MSRKNRSYDLCCCHTKRRLGWLNPLHCVLTIHGHCNTSWDGASQAFFWQDNKKTRPCVKQLISQLEWKHEIVFSGNHRKKAYLFQRCFIFSMTFTLHLQVIGIHFLGMWKSLLSFSVVIYKPVRNLNWVYLRRVASVQKVSCFGDQIFKTIN